MKEIKYKIQLISISALAIVLILLCTSTKGVAYELSSARFRKEVLNHKENTVKSTKKETEKSLMFIERKKPVDHHQKMNALQAYPNIAVGYNFPIFE